MLVRRLLLLLLLLSVSTTSAQHFETFLMPAYMLSLNVAPRQPVP
jgi:hypothetical protein